jgi:hypothetical protein
MTITLGATIDDVTAWSKTITAKVYTWLKKTGIDNGSMVYYGSVLIIAT